MRIQSYIIALLMSMIMWAMSFDVARDVYHNAQEAGAMPNLHIHNHIHSLIDQVRDTGII